MGRSVGWALGWGAVLGIAGMPVASCSSTSSHPGQLGGTGADATTDVHKEASVEASQEAEAEAATDGAAGNDGGCDGGLSLCSGLCVDTQTDPQNCSKCGNACGTDALCIGGICHCNPDAGETLCSGVCVETLTDPNNCGACGHTCQVQGSNTCAGGYCQPAVVATPNNQIWAIAVSPTTIYWTQPASGGSAGQILSKPFAAGSQIATITNAVADPRGIALDLTNVYWVNYGSTAVEEYKLLGGSPIIDWPATSDAGAAIPPVYPQPIAVAVDATYVYWVSNQPTGQVLRVPIGSATDTAPTVLQGGEINPVAIAVDDTNVYWLDQGTSTSTPDGSVRQKAKDGSGTAITLAANEPSPWGLVIDSKNVYWTDKVNPGFVKQITIGATSGAIVLAQNEGAPYGIAIDPEQTDAGAPKNIYWTDFDDNTVNKVPVGGGTKFVYAVQQGNPAAIAVDKKNIYWVNQASGTILEVTQ